MTTQLDEIDIPRQAWSIVVSKRAEVAAIDGGAYALLDRVAEHVDDEIFDLRLRLNIAAHAWAVFGD